MVELFVPPMMGFFGTGYCLALAINWWQRRQAMEIVSRWLVADPTQRELDIFFNDIERAHFMLLQLRGSLLAGDDVGRPTGGE